MRSSNPLTRPITETKTCALCRSWRPFVDHSGWGECIRPKPGVAKEQCSGEHYACADFQEARHAR